MSFAERASLLAQVDNELLHRTHRHPGTASGPINQAMAFGAENFPPLSRLLAGRVRDRMSRASPSTQRGGHGVWERGRPGCGFNQLIANECVLSDCRKSMEEAGGGGGRRREVGRGGPSSTTVRSFFGGVISMCPPRRPGSEPTRTNASLSPLLCEFSLRLRCPCRYQPGEGIKAHVDLVRFADGIAAVSLGSSAVMVFRRAGPGQAAAGREMSWQAKKQKKPRSPPVAEGNEVSRDDDTVRLLLLPGDLLCLEGDARWKWTHEIEPVATDQWGGTGYPRARRVSVTFRQLATNPAQASEHEPSPV